MAWRPPGIKPLPELMMVRLTMHIYVTRPQWVNLCILITFLIGCTIYISLEDHILGYKQMADVADKIQ